jgi:hypothetical protein
MAMAVAMCHSFYFSLPQPFPVLGGRAEALFFLHLRKAGVDYHLRLVDRGVDAIPPHPFLVDWHLVNHWGAASGGR